MAENLVVAFIGLGNMGFPMVSRLVDAGFTVRGSDVAPEALARLEHIGAEAHATAAEAVEQADVVVLMLPNSDVVGSVIDDLLSSASLRRGATIVDMSSSEPLATRALATRLADCGVSLVDAPVSGGVKGATEGTLTVMVGGEDADVDTVLPILEAIGRPVRCGPVGAGHAIKALNNLLSATHLWATSEAMETGVAFGLDPEVMLSVFNASSGRSGSTENKWPNFVLPGGYDSGFGLALMLKDMRIALGLAQSNESPRSISAVAVKLWAQAADALPASADHTEVARWIAADTPDPENESSAAPRPWKA